MATFMLSTTACDSGSQLDEGDSGTGEVGPSETTSSSTQGTATGDSSSESVGDTSHDSSGDQGDDGLPDDSATTGQELCPERVSELIAKTAIDFEPWHEAQSQDWSMNGFDLDYRGLCSVEAVGGDRPSEVVIIMNCETEADQVARLVLTLTSEPFHPWLPEFGREFEVELNWQSEAHHRLPSSTVVVRDAEDGHLAYVGVTGQWTLGVGDRLAPLAMTLEDASCESVCLPQWCYGGIEETSQRQTLKLTGAGTEVAELLDGSVGTFDYDGRRYSYSIALALTHRCLNCWSSYEFAWYESSLAD